MSGAEKCSLELRWRQIHSAIEHGAEEASEGFAIQLRSRDPVRYWAGSKEPRKHGTDTVEAPRDPRFSPPPWGSPPPLPAYLFELRINFLLVLPQMMQRCQSGG